MPGENPVVIPEAVASMLLDLALLEIGQLDGLYSCLNNAEFVRYRPEVLGTLVERKTKIDFRKAYDSLQVIAYLLEQRNVVGASEDELFSAIRDSIQKANKGSLPPDFETKREKIRLLFEPKPEVEIARKRQRLLYGPVKALRRIESVCDARPLFNLQRTAIQEILYVEMVQLFMADDDGNEDVVVFQMNEKGLQALEDFLDVLHRKKEIISRNVRLGGPSTESKEGL